MLAVWSRNTTGVLDATRSISSYFVIRPIGALLDDLPQTRPATADAPEPSIVARLEKTNELLELIQDLMPDSETDIQPQPATTLPSIRDCACQKSTTNLDD